LIERQRVSLVFRVQSENMSSSPQPPDVPQVSPAAIAAAPYGRPLIEDPAWTGWAVLRMFFVAVALLVASVICVAITTKLVVFRQYSFMVILTFPLVNFAAQMLAYLALLMYMVIVATRKGGEGFWQAIGWNWPRQGIGLLVALGLVTYFLLVAFARVLPLPKKSPFDEFFKHPLDAYAIAVLAITFGPLMEELFFRGFLYPVLARRFGLAIGVFLTALPFALIHLFEYGAWGPVLIIFLVGVVLTIVRAKRHSVASSFIVHGVYNGVQMAVVFVATQGFRHLEKMTQ